MLLWISFALLTAITLAIVLGPAFRGQAVPPATAPDLALYTEQLADLDRQLAHGQLQVSEHTALKVEVSRRILRTEHPVRPGNADAMRALWASVLQVLAKLGLQPLFGRLVAASAKHPLVNVLMRLLASARPVLSRPLSVRTLGLALGAIVPGAAMALYLLLGAPSVPARPYAAAAQTSLANAPAADLIAKVEARLASDPGDGRGWDVIAPVYFKLQRFTDAAGAYARAMDLLGETPARLAGFAEATVVANDGIVTEPARAAYEKLAKLTPDRIEPRFWLALAKEQDGRRDAAAADYRTLLATLGIDPQSRTLIEQRLAAVTGQERSGQERSGQERSGQPQRGPTASDVAATRDMSETDRRAMIEGMVANLAARLKTAPRDLEGWQRLVNAYVVLKDPAKARAALAEARLALAGDGAAEARLADLARQVEAAR